MVNPTSWQLRLAEIVLTLFRIFIIEGLITVVLGVVSKFWITDWPETAKFLNEDERALLIARLSDDSGEAVMNRLDKRAARRIFSDPKVYLGTLAYFGIVNTGYAGSFFVPTIGTHNQNNHHY